MHFFSLISTKNKSKNKNNHTYKRHTSIPSGCPYHISHSFTVTYVTVWLRHVSLHQVQYLDIEITMRVVVISIKRYLNGWVYFTFPDFKIIAYGVETSEICLCGSE